MTMCAPLLHVIRLHIYINNSFIETGHYEASLFSLTIFIQSMNWEGNPKYLSPLQIRVLSPL